MSLARIRAELAKLWGPEERVALSQAYKSAGIDYAKCAMHKDGQIVLDLNCYRTQGAALKDRYKELWSR